MIMEETEKKSYLDPDYDYASICSVVYDKNNDRYFLNRLADVDDNGRIIPFIIDPKLPYKSGNRNKLYYKTGPKIEGYIGLWNWRTEQLYGEKEHVIADIKKGKPIEIFLIEQCNSINEVIDILKEGVDINTDRKCFVVAIECDKTFSGILLSKKQTKDDGGLVYLKDNVEQVESVIIQKEDTIILDSRVFINDLSYEFKSSFVRINSPSDIIKKIFLKRINNLKFKERILDKDVYRILRNFLSVLPDRSMVIDLMESYSCNEIEAEAYIDDFIKNAKSYIDGENIENRIMNAIVLNDETLIQKCKEIIEEDWKNDNRITLELVNEEIKSINDNISSKKEELNIIQKELKEKQCQLDFLSSQLSEKEKLALDVDERIKNKIDDAKKNAADFISQMAFITPTSAMNGNTIKSCYKTGLAIDTEDIEEYDDVNTLHSLISEELQNAGVSSKYRDSLAAYMYSAYLTHTPLLLAGPCGKSIANAFSSALNARLAGVLNCSNPFDSEALKEVINSNDNVVIIENPFSSEWIYTVLDIISTPDKFIILVTPFTEDLSIEPRGLLNYVLPIFTELFVDSEPTNAFIGSKASEGYIPPVGKNGSNRLYNRILSQMRMSLLSVKRINAVVEQTASIYEVNEGTDLLFILLPCAYVTENNNKLLEMIHNKNNPLSKASPDYIKIVEHYLGEYDE